MKDIKKVKKLSALGVFGIAVLICIVLATSMQSAGLMPKTTLTVWAAGTPDSYGNRIRVINFDQNGTGSWTLTATLSYTGYNPGANITINSNQHTIIEFGVRLNVTLAPDVNTASQRTRVYINITGVVTNGLCIYKTGGTEYGGDFYLLYYQWPSVWPNPSTTWMPGTNETYSISALYQAYY